MRPFTLLVALTALVYPIAGCGQGPPTTAQLPSVRLPPELDRVLRDYETAWRAQDAAGLSQLFADGRVIMTNSGRAVLGRDAVRQAYANGGGPLVLRAMSYAMDDTVAHIIGAYTMRLGRGTLGRSSLRSLGLPAGAG